MRMGSNKTVEEMARDVIMKAPLHGELLEALASLERVAQTLRADAKEHPMQLGHQFEVLHTVVASIGEMYARERAARAAALPVYTKKLLERPAGSKAVME